MRDIAENITSIRNQAIAQISECENQKDLTNLNLKYLGKNGILTNIFKKIKNLPPTERKTTGILINETKKIILSELSKREKAVFQKQTTEPTIPGYKIKRGSIHLVTQAIEEISEVFEKIGFVRTRYPEVEWDFFAFESLNFTKDHPARDDWETFFVDAKPSQKYGPMLLTPHTSSGQVREMQRVKTPPIRMVNIAKCYRRQQDVSHVPMFHQFEGLVIDEGISISNLRGTLDYFAKNFFGEKRVTRLRPYNFPFTEPSFEVDISCDYCNGAGCKLCKAGWLELGGAGMVHPNVLKAGGINPEKYSGFAFGWGVERTFMMKSGIKIPDVRILYSSDLRYLRQF